MPRLELKWLLEGPAPPVRNEGLFATAGRPEPEPPPPPAAALVAMAVGKTKDGESFPAKPGRSYISIEIGYRASNRGAGVPSLEKPVPLLSRYLLAKR